MILQHRIDLLARLRDHMISNDTDWVQAKEKAVSENSWFTPEFVQLAIQNIAENFLRKDILQKWTASYQLPATNNNPKLVGIVMAGNIPLVGFHDFLCVFIAGHKALIKPSSKDKVLIDYLIEKIKDWNKEVIERIQFADIPKGCDAYIATGSNNSAGYFEYYFKKYAHIIRRNRTSVAILTGRETHNDLEKLADDICLYFGLGCRNVTKIFVPPGYDFVPLLAALKRYDHLADHHKYKNNYDYNLAINLLNKKFYMSTSSILLVEDSSPFSPISQLHYEFYSDINALANSLKVNKAIQCIVGAGYIPPGSSQCPAVTDYADGADTMAFVARL